MALLLDTENTIMIATDADDMARKLTRLLDDNPDEETLAHLAAAILGCDVLDVIITHTETPCPPAPRASVDIMDTSLRLASLTAFYFGTHAATKAPTEHSVINIAARRAYRDLSRTLTGIGTHPDKKKLLDDTRLSLCQFVDTLAEVDSRDDFDARHDAWCQERINVFAGHPHGGREVTFTYGHAQKWLNMTGKYLAVLNHPEIQRCYPYLHVPIDTVVYAQADQLGVPRPPRRRAWSRLDREHYLTYHDQIRTQIAEQTDYSVPLDWEAAVWVDRPAATH